MQINPHIVHGMTYGGIAHGIGAALYEKFEYNDVNATISVNNFVTEFNFIEETGEMGNDSAEE